MTSPIRFSAVVKEINFAWADDTAPEVESAIIRLAWRPVGENPVTKPAVDLFVSDEGFRIQASYGAGPIPWEAIHSVTGPVWQHAKRIDTANLCQTYQPEEVSFE